MGSATTTSATSTKASSTLPVVATEVATTSTDSLSQFSGKYLDFNMREIAFSPTKKILSLVYNPAGDGSKISVSNFDGTKKQVVLSSPLREWLIYFPTETKAVLATKPSGSTDGFAYILDIAKGVLTKVAGNLPGLTVLPSRDLSSVLVGSGGQTVSLSITKIKDGSILGSLNPLPEKCVWAKKDNTTLYCAVPESIQNSFYPDAWYKGLISFNDQIWKIDTKAGISKSISTPEIDANTSIDAVNLDISPDDNYLTFTNKKDLTLWGLTLETPVATSTATSTAVTNTSLKK
ncbi:Uncharacterised protein [uncultured archaeon]|nr:Uncharacterised protein [uncultured archaeon]